MNWSLIIEIVGFCLGLLYLWYEYHASRKVFVVGVIMPCISMWIYFSKGLYADFGITVYYFLMALYGLYAWRHGKPDKKGTQERPIAHIGAGKLAGAIAAVALLTVCIAWFLDNHTDSTVPWYDAFTTALSIVASWMLAQKYIEQWIFWIVVDAASSALYSYKGIYFYCALYAIYTVIAFFGYRKWKHLMTMHNT